MFERKLRVIFKAAFDQDFEKIILMHLKIASYLYAIAIEEYTKH